MIYNSLREGSDDRDGNTSLRNDFHGSGAVLRVSPTVFHVMHITVPKIALSFPFTNETPRHIHCETDENTPAQSSSDPNICPKVQRLVCFLIEWQINLVYFNRFMKKFP